MKKSKKKLPKDPNKLAYEIVRLSTEDSEEDLHENKLEPKKPTKTAYKEEK